MKLRTLDLFAGIGGISLGLERTGGFETVGFCEIDKAAQKVLKKHWPDVPIFEDVKSLSAKDIDGPIDVITGGFPCQDISVAGKGAGLAGARSGLWFEFHRLIQEAKPKWVIAENVSALRSRGLDQVLRSLAEIGYDAEWHCIPASAVGAPHRRDRIWILAYPSELQRNGSNHNTRECMESEKKPKLGNCSWEENVAHSGSLRPFSKQQRDAGVVGEEGCKKEGAGNQSAFCSSSCSSEMAHTSREGLERQWTRAISAEQEQSVPSSSGCIVRSLSHSEVWDFEPNVGQVANGVPGRVDRLKQLGNAVVPQIPELLGKAILEQGSL
jgi:DNA (cytosine-5)-methyltransferase 1